MKKDWDFRPPSQSLVEKAANIVSFLDKPTIFCRKVLALILAMAWVIVGINSCKEGGKEKETDDEEKYQLMLEGVWSFDASGNSTRINYDRGIGIAEFVSFAQDQWKELADAGKVKPWNTYFVNLNYQGKGEFTCTSYDYTGASSQRYDTTIKLAADGKTLNVKTAHSEAIWYKQSVYPIKKGDISFWTASDRGWGYIGVQLYDASYSFDYNPLDGFGNLDKDKYDKYESEHLIDRLTIIFYVPSGYPGCGGNGSYTFRNQIYGTYKYRASDRGKDWSGTINLNSECILTEIK